MYPKDKITAALMSDTIRSVLADKNVMDAIIKHSDKKPPYWDMMDEKNGITAIVIAQMLKAMAGDTAAFNALSKYGFGEKVQIDTSDFYRTDNIRINVVTPQSLTPAEPQENEQTAIEGEICGPGETSTDSQGD